MYLPQSLILTHHLSIRNHLQMVCQVFGGHERMDSVVTTMRLEELLDLRPQAISGGEERRVALAMALLRNPDCLLMDEPFAGVAPSDRPLVHSGLAELRDRGAALLVTGHEVDDVLALCDEVIWVVAGTTHWLGSPEQARAHHQFAREYLGVRSA